MATKDSTGKFSHQDTIKVLKNKLWSHRTATFFPHILSVYIFVIIFESVGEKLQIAVYCFLTVYIKIVILDEVFFIFHINNFKKIKETQTSDISLILHFPFKQNSKCLFFSVIQLLLIEIPFFKRKKSEK